MVPRENLEESVVRTGRDFPVSMPYNFCKFKKLIGNSWLSHLFIKNRDDVIIIRTLIRMGNKTKVFSRRKI